MVLPPVDATGSRGNVKMILSLVNRVDVPRITAHLQSTNPHAFFSIEDVRYVNEGVFRPKKPNALTGLFHSFIRPRMKNNSVYPQMLPFTKELINDKLIIE